MAFNFKDFEKNIDSMDKVLLGADVLFKNFDKFLSQGNFETYPPHNVVKTENGISVEIAVAGFTKDEVNVEIDGDMLVVKANKSEPDTETNYVHKGIAKRAFAKKFRLNDNIDHESIQANFENGLLIVSLNYIKKKDKKKKVKIK